MSASAKLRAEMGVYRSLRAEDVRSMLRAGSRPVEITEGQALAIVDAVLGPLWKSPAAEACR